jgi:hypothetical protein
MFRFSRSLFSGLLALVAGAVGCQPSQPQLQSGGADPVTDNELADVEPPPVLHLLPSSRESVWHTRRHANGAWDPFGNVEDQAGELGFVTATDARYTPGRLFVSQLAGDRPWLTMRFDDGRWAPFVRLRMSNGTDASAVSTGLGQTADANIHVCAGGVNRLLHGIWSVADDRFSGFNEVIPQTGDPGPNVGVGDCAGVGLELLYAVFTRDFQASVRIAVRRANGTWTGFTTTHVLDGSQGNPVDLDLESTGTTLHMVVTTTKTQLHATNSGAGWTELRDVEGPAGDPRDSVQGGAAAAVGGELHLSQVTLGILGSRVMHTIRFANGSWAPYRDVAEVVGLPTQNFTGFFRVAMSASGNN